MTGHRAVLAILIVVCAFAAPAATEAQPPSVSPWPEDWLDPTLRDSDRWRPRRMGPRQKIRMERHWTYMNERIPPPYRGRMSPLESTPETIAAGEEVYARHCAQCHGERGFGDGDAGRALDPSPALLSFMVRMPMAVDEYLLWSVSEGGLPFGSEMPAFKDRLSEEQIWQVIAFMRAGFPTDAAAR
jgi:mono/diheme cytochrome c family protein